MAIFLFDAFAYATFANSDLAHCEFVKLERDEWMFTTWQYREDCNCDKCKEERQQMATGGKTTYGDGSVAGPEEVTTKTLVFKDGALTRQPAITAETAEERNNRIWEAIRGASGG